MPFDFFESASDTIMNATPNDFYRANQQAFQDEEWTNTSAKTPENGGEILEQQGIGSAEYRAIEAWVKPTVADTSTGLKDTKDFMKLIFRSIDKTSERGLYYKFDNSWWIVHAYTQFAGLPQDVAIRRCNNSLRIIDPATGKVFSAPCVVDYDMQSPNARVTRYLLTPNNHATVMVQGNADTLRLFKLNTRYILGGRPFKLWAYQNALNPNLSTDYDTLLYLDLYLDEEHDGDDIANQLADNSSMDYSGDDDLNKILDNAGKLGGGN